MVDKEYVPRRGDVIWIDFTPQSGHEQADAFQGNQYLGNLPLQKTHITNMLQNQPSVCLLDNS